MGMLEIRKVIVSIQDQDGVEQTLVQSVWNCFLNGHWTTSAPMIPGRYPVADYTGKVRGDVIVDCDGTIKRPIFPEFSKSPLESKWEIYFWTEPVPSRFPVPFPGKETVRTILRPPVANVVIVDALGEACAKGVSQDWEAFLEGHFTCRLPSKKGRYFSVSESGAPAEEVFCYQTPSGELKSCVRRAVGHEIQDEFSGWIWSVSVPRRYPLIVPIYDTFLDKFAQVQRYREQKAEQEAIARRRGRLWLVRD